MTTFKNIAPIGLLLVTLSPVSAMDEYQKYKSICPSIHSLKIDRPGFLDCRCDFNVRDIGSMVVSEIDMKRGEVVKYFKDDDGKLSEAFVEKNCKATSAARTDYECSYDWGGSTRLQYRLRNVFMSKGNEIKVFTEIIDNSTGAVFFDSLKVPETGRHVPIFFCYKEKSIFDFKMPWK